MAKQIVTKTLESGAKVSSIGTVKSVIGVVTATGSDGVVRTLQVGDKVFMNDMILTSASGAVLVEFNNGGSFDLGRDSSATLDQSVFQPTPAPSSEGAKEDVASLQAKMVGHYALTMRFSDGHHTGIYTFPFLRHNDPKGA